MAVIKEFSTVKIKTKPHIKCFLEYQFGTPCKIPSGHFVNEHLNILLSKTNKDDNCKTAPEAETVIICINEKTFRRYGYGLTITNRRNFNLVIDNFIKSQIYLLTENILNNNHRNEDWKKKYIALKKENDNLILLSKMPVNANTLKEYKKVNIQINKRLREHKKHRIKEKTALLEASESLGLNINMISMDALLKGYYRYRMAQTA